jgi:arylsulfatase A-like enzyme
LRPDALDPVRTPTILALAASGAFTPTAQTIHPSATLPAHGSMLSGYDVEQHGLTWNDYIPENGFVLTATLFSWPMTPGCTPRWSSRKRNWSTSHSRDGG